MRVDTARLFGALLLLALPIAAAQQPLNTPHYFLSTTPLVAVGELRVAALSTSSGQNFKDGSYLALYLIPAQAGEIVDLFVESNDFAPQLTLYSPQGQLVEANAYASGHHALYAARIRSALEGAGNHLLVVSGSAQRDVGSFTLLRNQVVTHPPVTHTLAFPGTLVDRLAAFSSHSIVVTLSEATWLRAELRSSDFDTYLEIYGSHGALIAENDDDIGTDSQLTLELEAGRYEFVVSGYVEDAEGDYRFNIAPHTPLEPRTWVISTPGDYNGSLLPEAIDVYLLEFDRPQRVIIELSSNDFDTYLEVFSAAGGWIDSNDDANGSDSRLELTLAAGRYRVEASGFWSDDEGAYRIRFSW